MRGKAAETFGEETNRVRVIANASERFYGVCQKILHTIRAEP